MPIHSSTLNRLKSQVANGELVLFTGAGFSRAAYDRSKRNIPTVDELRQALFAICFPGEALDPGSTLGELYELASRRHSSNLQTLLQTRLSIDAPSLPDFYRAYFEIPWQRCYTLNVDDLPDALTRRFDLPRRLFVISATQPDPPSSGDIGSRLEIVCLNGTIAIDPTKLTFSETQYAERIANQEPWYARCVADLMTRPVVFIGTELREVPLWQHMELRRRRYPEGRDLRPSSILVSPSLAPARREMLKDLRIEWYPGTAEQFAIDVLPELSGEPKAKGFAFLRESHPAGGRHTKPRLVSALAAERPTLATEYLLGAEPEWADLLNGRAIERANDAALHSIATEIVTGARPFSALAITGTAGSGKSTALKSASLFLSNAGVPVFWLDRDSEVPPTKLKDAIWSIDGPVGLAVDDADIFGSLFVGLLRDLVPKKEKMLCMFAVRSSRIDQIALPIQRGGEVQLIQHVVPPLTDDDIDRLIDVLDRHNRLGILKAASREKRRAEFAEQAGRQILVAMIQATSGERFDEKIESELNGLTSVGKAVYALVCVATSHRHFLTRDEVLLAAGTHQKGDAMAALERLVAHHLVVANPPAYEYRTRHRAIADVVMECLTKYGQMKEPLIQLAYAAASKVTPGMDRRQRPQRLVRRLTNHEYLLNVLGMMDARELYREIEQLLHFDFHYWLQRGSLEVEAGDLRLAEQFLNQARSLAPDDHRVLTEYGYLLMRKAVDAPHSARAPELLQEGMDLLEDVIAVRGKDDSYSYHIVGSQGLSWVRRGITGADAKRQFLRQILDIVEQGLALHPLSSDLRQLREDLRRELLMGVVDNPPAPRA